MNRARIIMVMSLILSALAAFPRHATRIIHQIQRRPAVTHGIIGFMLFGGSDAFAQQIEASTSIHAAPQDKFSKGSISSREESSYEVLALSPLSRIALFKDHFDMIRFLSAGAIGAFFGGHVYPFAYKRLDMLFAGNGFMSIVKKGLVEVFTVGIFANSVSMGARGVLVGKNPLEVLSHVKQEMPEITLNDLRVWFPYNMIAFGRSTDGISVADLHKFAFQ